jgi:RHS repeat-associated protein
VRQDVSGTATNYLWDEFSPYGDVVLEYGTSGTPIADYTLAGGQLLSQTRGATTNFYLPDAQGSIRGLASSGGSITDTYDYTAYGELFAISGTTTNTYRYTGQQFDALTGLYNLRARSYDPGVGRFLSQDTYLVNYRNPIELNRYGYTANNPVNGSDPTGHNVVFDYGKKIYQDVVKDRRMLGGYGGMLLGIGLSTAIYLMGLSGQCGDPFKDWAKRINPLLLIGGSAVLGFYIGYGQEFYPVQTGAALAALGLLTLYLAAQDADENGATPCNTLQAVFGVAGIVGGLGGIAGGLAGGGSSGGGINLNLGGNGGELALAGGGTIGGGTSIVGVGGGIGSGAAVGGGVALFGGGGQGGGSDDDDDAPYTPDWVKELIEKRTVDRPSGVGLEEGVETVKQTFIDHPKVNFKNADDVVTILEINRRWYLGLNGNLDGRVASAFPDSVARVSTRIGKPPIGWWDHAETNAIAEFWMGNGSKPVNGINGRMHVSRMPCSTCVFDEPPPFRGRISQIMWDIGISELEISFSGSPGRFGTNSFTIQASDPRRPPQ